MKGVGTRTSEVVLPMGLGARDLCGQAVLAFGIVLVMACMCQEMCIRGSKCLP